MSQAYFQCPYCNADEWIEIEGQDQYSEYFDNCSKCGKRYSYRIEFSVDVYADKIEGVK